MRKGTAVGIGPGKWDSRALGRAQEKAAVIGRQLATAAVIYRLYTEDRPNLYQLVARYFGGATFTLSTGLWQGQLETSRVIEIVGTLDDLQRITDLAGDIRATNEQSGVLVTYSELKRLDV
jgi:hypothetical protein